MITVGDQIFALTQEVKKLKKQCQAYEHALRDIADGNGRTASNDSPASVAQHALAETTAPAVAGS